MPRPDGVCTVDDPRAVELSGLVATADGYVAIDSQFDSDQVRILYLDGACQVTRTAGYPTAARDPEDLAVAPDGTLWVADIGDNVDAQTRRQTIALWRVPAGGGAPVIHRLTYPDGPHDAEALLFAGDGMPVIVTKELSGPAGLYQPTAPLLPGTAAGVPLKRVGEFRPTATGENNLLGGLGEPMVTGAATSPDRRRVALRTYTAAYEWDVPDGDVVKAITTSTPRLPPCPTSRRVRRSPTQWTGGVPDRQRRARADDAAPLPAVDASRPPPPGRAATLPPARLDEPPIVWSRAGVAGRAGGRRLLGSGRVGILRRRAPRPGSRVCARTRRCDVPPTCLGRVRAVETVPVATMTAGPASTHRSSSRVDGQPATGDIDGDRPAALAVPARPPPPRRRRSRTTGSRRHRARPPASVHAGRRPARRTRRWRRPGRRRGPAPEHRSGRAGRVVDGADQVRVATVATCRRSPHRPGGPLARTPPGPACHRDRLRADLGDHPPGPGQDRHRGPAPAPTRPGSGRRPVRRCRTSRPASRRRCGSP